MILKANKDSPSGTVTILKYQPPQKGRGVIIGTGRMDGP
jgi:hypothetical protein